MVALTFADGYSSDVRSRWGYSAPVHPELNAVLEQGRPLYEQSLDEIARFRAVYHDVVYQCDPNSTAPCWDNIWFTALDAASLVGFLLSKKPKRYLEIGSGYSTMFARYAISTGKLQTKLSSIDPNPRANIDKLCDYVFRANMEQFDIRLFQELEAGDILFYDGSHRVLSNTDATVFFLEVLPRLKPGVIVHIHDIFLPADYPPSWHARFYNEQFLLAAMLLCGAPPFRVLFPNYFVSIDPALGARVREMFKGADGRRDIPYFYANDPLAPGSSFWLETVRNSAP